MLDVLKITIVFLTMLGLLRLKWNIGHVMLIASALLFLLYLVPVPVILSTVRTTVTDAVTIKLFFALALIRVFEIVLREKNVLVRMMEASQSFLRRKKAVIVSMPMLIGLLPSLGGAYFSAPMVEESTKDLDMQPEEKGFINYWFRHPWEYILPLYPGILLAAAITKVELRSLILANLPYAMLMVVTGFLFSMRGIKEESEKSQQSPVGSPGSEDPIDKTHDSGHLTDDYRLLSSFLPIAAVLFLVIAFGVELHYALGMTIVVLFFFYRLSAGEIVRVLKYGFTADVLVLIFGTMCFKFSMESSGAVKHLNQFFAQSGVALLPVLFVLPFVSGLLTGLTVGFVGSTFPLIISLSGGAHLNQLTFAFAAGFTGVLLSPVHLCLVLTREYFKADMWGIYRKAIQGGGIVLCGAIIEYMVL